MFFKKLKRDIQEDRAQERTQAMVEKQAALLEYVAIMADVELPEDGIEESEVVENE